MGEGLAADKFAGVPHKRWRERSVVIDGAEPQHRNLSRVMRPVLLTDELEHHGLSRH